MDSKEYTDRDGNIFWVNSGPDIPTHYTFFHLNYKGDIDEVTKLVLPNILHRENNPAVLFANGHREWWINGMRHRQSGPAITYNDGLSQWYLFGIHLPDNDWTKQLWMNFCSHTLL